MWGSLGARTEFGFASTVRRSFGPRFGPTANFRSSSTRRTQKVPRPRTLDAHPREFFAFTEELLTVPSRTVDCGGPGPPKAPAPPPRRDHFRARPPAGVEAPTFNLAEPDPPG